LQVVSRRDWAEIETEVTKGLERIDPAHIALRVEFGTGLAKALLHLKRPAEKVMAVADVRSVSLAEAIRLYFGIVMAYRNGIMQTALMQHPTVQCTVYSVRILCLLTETHKEGHIRSARNQRDACEQVNDPLHEPTLFTPPRPLGDQRPHGAHAQSPVLALPTPRSTCSSCPCTDLRQVP
jgi:hypothetical protein